VGHAIGRKATGGRPGRVISAKALGKALRSTGLWEADTFLRRVREEFVPSLQTIRDELFRRFPGARRFVEVIYPADLDEAAERVRMEGP